MLATAIQEAPVGAAAARTGTSCGHRTTWVVELATRRVVRLECQVCVDVVASGPESATPGRWAS